MDGGAFRFDFKVGQSWEAKKIDIVYTIKPAPIGLVCRFPGMVRLERQTGLLSGFANVQLIQKAPPISFHTSVCRSSAAEEVVIKKLQAEDNRRNGTGT